MCSGWYNLSSYLWTFLWRICHSHQKWIRDEHDGSAELFIGFEDKENLWCHLNMSREVLKWCAKEVSYGWFQDYWYPHGYKLKNGNRWNRGLVLVLSCRYIFELVEYVDIDFAGYQVERKSTSRMTHYLGSSLISWGTKKIKSILLLISRLSM